MTDADIENPTSKSATDSETQENNDVKNTTDSTASEELASENIEAFPEDWKNKAAYLAAEMDNMRKRFEREKRDFLRYANEELLKKFVPVMDNMLLALGSVKKSEQKVSEKLFEALVQGFEMTIKQLEKTFEGAGVEFIEAARGTGFDPQMHEAMGQGTDDSLEDGVVFSEFQRGFKLNGRVVRPAKVLVNKKSSGNSDQKDGE